MTWVLYWLFFFSSRRRHTRFDCDWSSDVCSSDLCRMLFIMVKNLPSGLNPASWPTHLMSWNSTSQVSGLELTFLTGRLPGEPSGMCRSEERRVGKECRSRWSPYH